MGATNCCNSSGNKGAPCPEYPGAGADCWPATPCNPAAITRSKVNVKEQIRLAMLLTIFFSPLLYNLTCNTAHSRKTGELVQVRRIDKAPIEL
jgi:hypothetical protein